MQLFLAAIVASLGLASVQPNNEAVTSDVVDPRKTQQNFVNFFESIGKNDTEQKETYRTILEEETRQEQQAFDSMKDEFRSSRLRNNNKQSQSFDENSDTDEADALHKREVDDEYPEYPEEPEATMGNTTISDLIKTHRRTTKYYRLQFYRPGPAKVQRILALRSDVNQLVATYTKLQNCKTTAMRYEQRARRGSYRPRNHTQITKSTTKGVYKRTSPSRKIRRMILHTRLIHIFSDFEHDKIAFFTSTERPPSRASTCYMKAYSCFMDNCLYDYYYKNTGVKDAKKILARACAANWLNAEKIVRIMKKCCGKRFRCIHPY